MLPSISDFDAFFRSKKNANYILELEKNLLSDDKDVILSSLDVFKDVITKIYQKRMLQASPNNDIAEEKYRLWLVNCYNDFVSHLVGYLMHENSSIQEKSLDTLLVLVQLEGDNSSKEGWFFPNDLFQKIVFALASQDVNQQPLIARFHTYTCWDDIKTYLLKSVLKLFQEAEQVTDNFVWNVFRLLDSLEYPKEFSVDGSSNTFLSRDGFRLQKKLFCKLFSSVWARFLKFALPPDLLREILVDLHERVLPHVSNPCLMTDFLTDAYKQGGELSLLSLNGLFYLIDKHNVEYPDFFVKLYSLFDETIVNGEFSAMFFSLSDLFLSSTHLPAYLVAAFVKKISRVAHESKTEVILRILPFVFNLLIRNPTLEEMLHKPSHTLLTDPYDFENPDPAESKALESSLWEIEALQTHFHPEISSKAKLIKKKLPVMEFNLSQILDTPIQNIFKKERKRKWTEAPLAVCKNPKLDNWLIF